MFLSGIQKWSKVFAVYSVYHVKIQLNMATQYTKHRKKCVCSKWEIYNSLGVELGTIMSMILK